MRAVLGWAGGWLLTAALLALAIARGINLADQHDRGQR